MLLGKNLLLSTVANGGATSSDLNSPFLGIQALGPTGNIHIDTIVISGIVMLIVLAAAGIVTVQLTSDGPGGLGQQIFESLYSFSEGIAKGQIQSRHKTFLPLIAGIFMFVLTANLIGIGPWKAFEPLFKSMGWTVQGEAFEITSPTTDINCVFALTIVSIVTYLVAGFFINGAPKFINSYFNPLNPHFYLELLDLIIRPTTLTLRLMLVISADEILRGVALQMVPFLAPSAVMAFEICIALIQAFVFAVLTSIYIGLTLQEH